VTEFNFKDNAYLTFDQENLQQSMHLGQLDILLRKEPTHLEIRHKHIYHALPIHKQEYLSRYININVEDKQPFRLRIVPEIPSQKIIIRQENMVIIPPKSKYTGFVYIPCCLALKLHSDQIVFQELSDVLSKTWFGPMASGQVGLVVKNKMSFTQTNQLSCWITCPITIHNQDKENLEFHRFLLNTDYLSLYLVEEKLWSNHIHMTYNNQEKHTKLRVLDIPPELKKHNPLLVYRNRLNQPSLTQQTFEKLMHLTESF
jgi:hypothetical protein